MKACIWSLKIKDFTTLERVHLPHFWTELDNIWNIESLMYDLTDRIADFF